MISSIHLHIVIYLINVQIVTFLAIVNTSYAHRICAIFLELTFFNLLFLNIYITALFSDLGEEATCYVCSLCYTAFHLARQVDTRKTINAQVCKKFARGRAFYFGRRQKRNQFRRYERHLHYFSHYLQLIIPRRTESVFVSFFFSLAYYESELFKSR